LKGKGFNRESRPHKKRRTGVKLKDQSSERNRVQGKKCAVAGGLRSAVTRRNHEHRLFRGCRFWGTYREGCGEKLKEKKKKPISTAELIQGCWDTSSRLNEKTWSTGNPRESLGLGGRG